MFFPDSVNDARVITLSSFSTNAGYLPPRPAPSLARPGGRRMADDDILAHVDGDDPTRNAVRRFMRNRGLKVTPWSRRAGLHEAALRGYLKGRSDSLNYGTLQKLAAAERTQVAVICGELPDLIDAGDLCNIPVITAVEALNFREAAALPPGERFNQVTRIDPDLAALPHFGAIVRDVATDEVYRPGTVLVCVPLDAWPHPLEDGNMVLVEQWRHGFVELLCRELRDRDGFWWLWPRSSHPDFQTPTPWRAVAAAPHAADAQAPFAPAPAPPADPPAWGSPKPDGMYVTAVVVSATTRQVR